MLVGIWWASHNPAFPLGDASQGRVEGGSIRVTIPRMRRAGRGNPGPVQMPPSLETTSDLLDLVRRGDHSARDRLIGRYLPILTRWARGRLPGYARDLSETDDLVQTTLVRALSHLNEFEVRREGAFLAYLRRGLLNSIRDEIRRSHRRPRQLLDDAIADRGLSVVEQAIGNETLELYEAALAGLTEEQREAVILKVEFGMSNPEIATALGSPTPNAARMVVARALIRVAEAMGELRP